MKIRTKLTVFFSIILFVLMLLLSVWYQYRLLQFLENETNRNLDFFSHGIIDRFKNDRKKNRDDKPDDYFFELLDKYTWYAIYDENLNIIEGTVFAKKFPIYNLYDTIKKIYFKFKIKANTEYFKLNEVQKLKDFNLITELGFYPVNNNYTFFCAGKTSIINKNGKNLYLIVLQPINKNLKYLRKTWTNVIFSLSFLIWIIIVLGLFYSKYTLNPINKIINDLNKISETDLSRRINLNKNTKDEIAAISSSINNLLDRIENAFNMEKQFIADVSHEFKTPISILQLNIDNICNNPNLTDEEIDKITSSLEILYSLDFLVKKLLYLSRLESNLCPFNPDTISVFELLNSIINNLQSITELKKIKFILKIEDENLMINGDRELLYIALYNIIENALKYTNKGHVLINAGEHNNIVRIIIEDTGIGIPKEKITRIFDKFFRVDPSRRDSKSFGIGLTITKRILDIHNAKIQIESLENTKTTFIIDFKK